jgi:hypothetical protein
MDKLEHYLDQVCRSIGGPKALREHVRQELREHLLDAVAEHKAAGMSEEKALERALEDFGGPDQVRLELEATHGHRLLPVVIDKAMQWKEKTMKAKWLWTSWAYLALVGVIALQVFFITFTVIFIVPKFQRLMHDGIIDSAGLDDSGASWMPAFLKGVKVVGGEYTLLWILVPALAWGLFEWRVRSENKPFMRLSALGTAAVGLMVVVVLTAASLVLSFILAVPAMGRIARPWAVEQVATIDTSISGLDQALAKKDWAAIQEQAEQASNAMKRLSVRLAATSLAAPRNQTPTVEELRADVTAANESLREAQQAIREKDENRLEAAMKKFHEAYGPVQAAAKPVKP